GQNAAADALSNVGMDGRTVVRDLLDGEERAAQEPVAQEPPAGALTAQPIFGEVRTPLSDLVFSTETTPTLEGSCRLVLVRPGCTAYAEQRRLDGRGGSDPGLSPKGRAQAEAAAGAVKDLVDRSQPSTLTVVTSSLRRARQTGGAIATTLGVQAQIDPDWDEQGFGDWDGLSMDELVEGYGEELLRLRREPDYARPGG